MFCKNCGSEIEEGGKFCPSCGTPVETPEQPAQGEAGKINVEKMAETASQAASQAAETVAQKAQEIGEKGKGFWEKANGENGFLKKMLTGKNRVILIVCAAVLVIAIPCIVNAARINNFFHKTFSSPEKYFHFVGRKSMDEATDLLSGYYDDIISGLDTSNTSYSGEFTLEPGEEMQRLIKLADSVLDLDDAGIDLSELKSLKIGADVSIKDNVFGYGFTSAINKVNLLSVNMVMALEQEELYLQIPELTKTYMGMDMGELMDDYFLDLDELTDMQETRSNVIKSLPKRAEVEKMLSRYFTLFLENIHDVSIGRKKELKVGQLSQKCTELKVTIDGETMQDAMEAILEEMLTDKKLEKIIVGVAEAAGEDGDEVYDEFVENLENRLDDLDYWYDDDDELKVTLYVDGKGNIIGIVMESEDYKGREDSFSALTARKGSKVAYEISSVQYGSDAWEISGQGKKSGDLLTGEFEVEVYGQSALELKVTKLDLEQLKRGYFNGRAEIALSSELSKELSYGIDVSAASSLIKKSTLVIDCKSSSKSVDCSIVINYDGEKLLGATLALKSGNGSKVSIPKGNSVIMMEDGDDFMDYYDTIDWNKFLDQLEKTGVLSELADKLEDVIDDLDDLEDMIDMFSGSYGGYGGYYY